MLSTPEQHSFQMRHQGMLLFGERRGGFGDNAPKAFFCCPSPPAAAFITTRTGSFYLPRMTITSFQATRENGSLWPRRQLNHCEIHLFTSFLVKKHTRETCKTQLEDKPLRQHWKILKMWQNSLHQCLTILATSAESMSQHKHTATINAPGAPASGLAEHPAHATTSQGKD